MNARCLRALSLFCLLAACDCDDTVAPCDRDDDAPLGCDASCGGEGDRPCRAGLYCDEDRGVCTADCVDDRECGEGQRCDLWGQCEERPEPMDGDTPERDGFVEPADAQCASVEVSARRVTPNVILIVDQSGSMTADFGDSNRWDALRDSLLDPDGGLIAALDEQVRFGLALYSARAEGAAAGPPIGECPLLTEVSADLNNYDAIFDVYDPADPIDETPTGDAIDEILDGILATPDPSDDPTIFILATDGEPDRCEELNPQNGQDEAIAAVTRAYESGIRTFIISVGDDISMAHLQDVANAGLGVRAGDPDAEFWVAGDDAGLRGALTDIVAGELSCVVELEGRLEDVSEACMGTVRLNDRELPCDDPNGWEAVDEDTIELLGDACVELQSEPGVTLTASFPCDVGIII